MNQNNIPTNVIKTCTDTNSSNSSISSNSYQTPLTSNILHDVTNNCSNNKNNNNNNNNNKDKKTNNISFDSMKKNDNSLNSPEQKKKPISNDSEEIRSPEKGYTLPLTSVDTTSYHRSNYSTLLNNNDILRTSSSPALNRYQFVGTSTSVATRLPYNNYNRNFITPESISEHYPNNSRLFNEKSDGYYSKNKFSTGTRTTTTIVNQPYNVNNNNVVVLPFSPVTTKKFSGDSTETSPSIQSPSSSFTNRAIASPSLTNVTANSTFERSHTFHYEDSFSSTNKKKLILKLNDVGHSQCVIPELVPQTPEEKNVAPEMGKMYVFIIRVNCQQKLYNPYVTVHLGDQQFSTCVSGMPQGLWNEGFMFDVSIHTQFFGLLTFNLYNGNLCLPDRFIGKCEIRIESLKNMPEMFDSWYELLDKNNKSPGAINIRIFYAYQDFHKIVKDESIEDLLMEADNDTENDITDREVKSREIPRQRTISRMGTVNEKEFAKFEQDFMNSLSKTPKYWYESIGKVFLSDEMFNVLKMIRRTLSSLGQGFNLSAAQLLEGILVLEKYYQKREPLFVNLKNSDKVVRNLTLVEKTRDLFRYSLAAYGWIGLNFVGKGKGMILDSMKKDSSIATIVNFLCILKEDILLYNFQPSKVFDQVYFIAYDRRYDAIVFSIRGTLNIKDTLADLVCEYVRWNGGLIHSGVLKSAIYFYKKLFDKLKMIIRDKRPKYLYLTGHSLGAGIAAALTIMLKNVENEFEAQPGFKIECYCFAPPSVLNIELSKVYDDCIFSYVNNNDIVPRLSYGSLMDLYEMVCAVISNDKDKEISLIKLLSSDSKAEEFIEKKLNEFEKCRNNLRTQTSFNTLNLKLCPPGKIYNILNNPEKNDEVILIETSSDDLTEIKVKKSMFVDHSFKGYLENLNSLFESTLLNRLNANMKVTYSPGMMNEDYANMSVVSTTSTVTSNNITPIKEDDEKSLSSKSDDSKIPNLLDNQNTIEREGTSKLREMETLDVDSSSSSLSIKSSATVSTSNVNISVSRETEI